MTNKESLTLTAQAFNTMQGEEGLEHLSDFTLWHICRAWTDSEEDMSFEDFYNAFEEGLNEL